MVKLNKLDFEKAAEYPPREYRDISAVDVLRWLKQANLFFAKFSTAEELSRQSELKIRGK
ncbi:MAG: hypothetical protein ABIE84_02435 [bacterium]